MEKSDNQKAPFIYKTPHSLSFDGWESWGKETKEKYPFQYWLREDVYYWFYGLKRKWDDLFYKVKCFFKPQHQEIRKAIPKTWTDISSLIVDVNFAMIVSFKKEADQSYVDWGWTEKNQEFKNWLDSSAHWITVGRPNCEAQADALYPPYPLPEDLKGKSYNELYGEMNKINLLIAETDTNILKQMIDYREYMWT
jgi:hypothetical protein